MQSIYNFSWLNSGWTITIVGGLIVIFLSKFFLKNKRVLTPSAKVEQKQTNHQKVIINNFAEQKTPKLVEPNSDMQQHKENTRILFIDDDVTFAIIDILKEAGWLNVSIINDITDLDDSRVRNTDVFFVDIKGVGLKLSPKDQGLALAVMIKDKYPEKRVCIYSSDPKGDRSHPALNKVDWFLYKYAEPIQFINFLERH